MRIGCCVNMFASPADPVGAAWISAVAGAGYDYVELPMAQMMELSETDFDRLAEQVRESGIPCACCNNFFLPRVRLTGPDVDAAQVEDYLRISTKRARKLGAGVIVFGSAAAKNVPEGFSRELAFGQLVDMLRRAAVYCEDDLAIAIEPLNSGEANITLNLAEGEALMQAVDSPKVRLLADFYHYALESDSSERLRELTPALIHTHFAEPEGRTFPLGPEPSYVPFFAALRSGGYNGTCSIEAYSVNPREDLRAGLAAMREIIG